MTKNEINNDECANYLFQYLKKKYNNNNKSV